MSRPCKNNPTGAEAPRKQTPEVMALLRHAFAIGATNIQACKSAGIGEATLYEWINRDPKLAEEIERLKNEPILMAKKAVVEAISSDIVTAKWYLEKKCKDEFGSRTEIDHTSKDGSMTPATTINVAKLSTAALKELMAARTEGGEQQ
jgi:hypothetical protein